MPLMVTAATSRNKFLTADCIMVLFLSLFLFSRGGVTLNPPFLQDSKIHE